MTDGDDSDEDDDGDDGLLGTTRYTVCPQVRKPAEAEKYRLEKIAEAERNRVVLEAEAEAEAQALRGEVFLFSIFDPIFL